MADPTLEQIAAHGEDCHPGLARAKADETRARETLAAAAAQKDQTEARLRSAELPIGDADAAAGLFSRGVDSEKVWADAEAARKADWIAGAELARARRDLEAAAAKVKALREEATDYIGNAARRLADREYIAIAGLLKSVQDAHLRAFQVRHALEGAMRDANVRARAALSEGERGHARDRYHAGRYVKTHVFEGMLGGPSERANSPYRQFMREAAGIGLAVD